MVKLPAWLTRANVLAFLKLAGSGVALPFVVTTVTNIVHDRMHDAEVQAHERADRATRAFRDESRAFEAAVASYVRHILDDKKIDPVSAELLTNNILKQMQLVQDVTPYLPSSGKSMVADYTNELIKFKSSLPSRDNPMALKDFWTNVSNLLVLRNRILEQATA